MCWTKNLRPRLGGENEIERNRKNNLKYSLEANICCKVHQNTQDI